MRIKIGYKLIAKYSGTVNEWIAHEDRSLDKVISEYKKLKKEHPHVKFKVIKVTEEVVKI